MLQQEAKITLATEFKRDGGGAPEGYYKRPIPSSCRAQKLQGWTLKFRITEPMSECKEGWKKHRGSCYRLAAGARIMSFKEEENNRTHLASATFGLRFTDIGIIASITRAVMRGEE